MATTPFGSTTTASNAPKSATYLPLCHRQFLLSNKLAFRLTPKPKLRISSKTLHSGWNCSAVVRAQLNEVSAGASTSKSEVSPSETKDVKLPPASLASEESIYEFITQISSLVKLVDSKDIVELNLKQHDCEVLIRKKEALAPPPVAYVQSQPQHALMPPAPAPAPSPVPSAAPSSAASSPAPASVPSPPKAQPSKSSIPPLKCPMAGTFYRSPAPGEPPFVKVGDKVKKGQVICIIEAMKLMNEIEADQSGTIVEIIAEDGKPVSVDTPLLVIEP